MLATTTQVARELGLNRSAALKLLETGVLGPVTYRGVRQTVDVRAVQALADAGWASDVEPALVIRPGEPYELLHEAAGERWRTHIGWCDQWDADRKRDAIRGDWVIDPDRALAAGRLVAVVSGFIVGAWTITGLDRILTSPTSDRRRARFTLADDPDLEARLRHRRYLENNAGWVAAVRTASPERT